MVIQDLKYASIAILLAVFDNHLQLNALDRVMSSQCSLNTMQLHGFSQPSRNIIKSKGQLRRYAIITMYVVARDLIQTLLNSDPN